MKMISKRLSFISYCDHTYQVIGDAPLALYLEYAPAFEQTVRSFAPVTDPSVLSIRPKRLDVVELPRALTVAQFARTYDSSVSVDELADLNHQSGPEARMPAGLPVKRVIS